jgi:hypothetical protein
MSVPFTPEGDNLLGRISNTATGLQSMTLDVYLGFAPSALSTVDSGIAYLIENVGLIGTVIFWCAFCASETLGKWLTTSPCGDNVFCPA